MTRVASDTEDLCYCSATELAEQIHRREVSPVEVVQTFLDRIERLNPILNAYLTVAADQALASAKKAEPLVGNPDAPLFLGVPISIKDLNDCAGIRTTRGSAAFVDQIATDDEAAVGKLKGAGFIVIGKTNTPEFGSAIITEPVAYGPCRNPWDTNRNSGGSSGGAASALASGMTPISHGSDGGGSIRIPSAWCGVYGLKPSRGRVSAAPAPQNMFAGQGPIARTVEDAAAMLDAMAGYVAGDAFWPPPPDRPFREEVGADPGRLRIAVTTERPGATIDREWASAVEATADLLSDLGHDVVTDAPPWTPLDPEHPVVKNRCAYMAAGEADLPPFEFLDPVNQKFIEVGRTLSTRDALLGDATAAKLSRSIVSFFDRYDVLVTPTNSRSAPLVGELRDDEDPWRALGKALLACPFTADWNMTGQPAVSLPLAVDLQGLPIGIQIVGRPSDEALLIRLSAQLEAARPWRNRLPPISRMP